MFGQSRWNFVESTMLRMYAQCLKKLNRKDEYVRTLLDLLAKSASERNSIGSSTYRGSREKASEFPGWVDDDAVGTAGIFQELIAFSEQLPYDVSAPMERYFGDITVEPYIRHFDSKDGFQLRLQLRHLLEDQITLSQARVRLISATSAQSKEIWLDNKEKIVVNKGMLRIWLSTNVRKSFHPNLNCIADKEGQHNRSLCCG